MAEQKEYPKRLYMKWDGDADEAFLHESEDADDLAVIGEVVLAGEYKLVKTVEIKNTTEVV